MADTLAASLPTPRRLGADAFFAGGIVAMLTILFLPIPPILIDLGLAFSIALSALIQALTQIQEVTLTFVPKIIVILVVVAISGSFIGAHLSTFTEMVYSRIEHGF